MTIVKVRVLEHQWWTIHEDPYGGFYLYHARCDCGWRSETSKNRDAIDRLGRQHEHHYERHITMTELI